MSTSRVEFLPELAEYFLRVLCFLRVSQESCDASAFAVPVFVFSPVTQTVEQSSRLPCPHSWGQVSSRVSHPLPPRAPSVARFSAVTQTVEQSSRLPCPIRGGMFPLGFPIPFHHDAVVA